MKLCRACLRAVDSQDCRSLNELHTKYELRYSELLERCAGVRAHDDSELSRALCAACCGRLAASWAFILMCRESDGRLHSPAAAAPHELTPMMCLKSEEGELRPEDDSKSEMASNSEDELLAEVARRRRPRAQGTVRAVTCAECGHRAPSECRYKKHVKTCHPELVHQLIAYPCTSCGKRFKRKSDLRVHARTHTGEKPFACERCPRRFAQSGTLIEHRRHHTGETPFRCELCRRAFTSRSSFWRHRRVHTHERPFSCAKCSATFAHAATLRTHALVHSEARPHVCRVCGKATKSKYALRQHASVHREREFVCERCGKTFAVKSNLELHARKMHGARAGRCAVCARDTSDLGRHALRHAPVPPFVCDVCHRAFRLKSALAFHLGFHNDADKYKCDSVGCERAFPKLNMLLFHTRKQHSNETPHVCAHCRRGFYRASDLTRHLNTAHTEAHSQKLNVTDSSTNQINLKSILSI